MKQLLAFPLAITCLLLLAEPALAVAVGTTATTTVTADPSTTTTVSLTPFYTYLNEGLEALLTGFAMVVAAWLRWAFHKYLTPYLGAQAEAKFAGDLNTALTNGVKSNMNALGAWETAHTDLDVKNAVAARAVTYAEKFAPDAVAYAKSQGLGAADLAEKALAFVPPPPAPTPEPPPLKGANA